MTAAMCLAGALDATVAGRGDAGEVDTRLRSCRARSRCGDRRDRRDAAAAVHRRQARRRSDADRSDYQTIYAAHDGAVAAPTAGLHFTPELMAALEARGISRHFVTLHVGAGTFLPVKADDTADHKMHFESGEISAATAAALNAVRARGGRIVAVGTTSLRLLETAARDGEIQRLQRGDRHLHHARLSRSAPSIS